MEVKKIFIIHCRRTGYGVIRSVIDQNYEIYGADTWKTPVSNSKYLKDFFVIPEITKVSDKEFLEILIQIAQKMNYRDSKPVVFTGDDNYLLFFAKHYDKLKDFFQFSFESNYSLLELALNKSKVNELAESIGVLAPKSYSKNAISDIKESEFPIIIKPALKKTPEINVVEKAFRLKICQNIDELLLAVNQLQSLNLEGIVQQYIPGNDDKLYTIGTYSFKGRLIAWSTSVKIRQFPPGSGECSFGKTIYKPELLEPAKKLLKALSLTGISQIEFKEYMGDFYLIEINPRIWSWHQIHSGNGVNLVQICLDNLNKKLKSNDIFSPLNDDEAYWQFFWMDLLYNRLLNKNVSFFKIFKDFFKSNYEAFFNFRDFKVFRAHTKRTITYIKRKYHQN